MSFEEHRRLADLVNGSSVMPISSNCRGYSNGLPMPTSKEIKDNTVPGKLKNTRYESPSEVAPIDEDVIYATTGRSGRELYSEEDLRRLQF